MPPTHNPLRGIALMVCATLCFALLDVTSKTLAKTFEVPLLVWIRYLVHCLFMVAVLGPRMGRGLVATTRPARQIVRAVLLVGVTGFAMAAFRVMPLAETTAIIFITPLLVALLAGPWLKEKMTPRRWAIVAAGFVGVLLIARPGPAVNAEGIGWALACAACYAVYQILTRQLSPTENTLTMLFYTALAGTVTMTLALPLFWGGPLPTLGQAGLMATMGMWGGTGHLLLISAFRHAPATTLSPFLYVQLFWATALGAIVFGHLPDSLAFTGMAVIVASGVALGLAERRPARA